MGQKKIWLNLEKKDLEKKLNGLKETVLFSPL